MVGLTRRRFCAGSALAGASLAIAGCETAGLDQTPTRTLQVYSALVGTAFAVRDPAGATRALRLSHLRRHSPPLRSGESRGEAFTLVFEAGEPMSLPQGTHPVSHPELGDFSLFLVPRGKSSAAGLPTYAATYCRI
jgi:hypothetical protein